MLLLLISTQAQSYDEQKDDTNLNTLPNGQEMTVVRVITPEEYTNNPNILDEIIASYGYKVIEINVGDRHESTNEMFFDTAFGKHRSRMIDTTIVLEKKFIKGREAMKLLHRHVSDELNDNGTVIKGRSHDSQKIFWRYVRKYPYGIPDDITGDLKIVKSENRYWYLYKDHNEYKITSDDERQPNRNVNLNATEINNVYESFLTTDRTILMYMRYRDEKYVGYQLSYYNSFISKVDVTKLDLTGIQVNESDPTDKF
jgi:hypothetical protein